MRLLFDENISPRLVPLLADLYPDSEHVDIVGYGTTDDRLDWRYAAEHGYVIATKDRDYRRLAAERGHPPKVVLIRRGNCPTAMVEALLRRHHEDLLAHVQDPNASILEIW